MYFVSILFKEKKKAENITLSALKFYKAKNIIFLINVFLMFRQLVCQITRFRIMLF